MQKLLNYFMLALVGVYGLKLVVHGDILYYLHQKYILFFAIGATICLLAGLAGLLLFIYQILKLRISAEEVKLPPKWIISNIPLFLFVIIGLSLPAKALTSTTASQRVQDVKGIASQQVSTYSPPQETKRIFPSDTKDYTYNHWFDLLYENPDPFLQEGKEVKLTGFVFKHESFESDVFVIARFMISHCAIDARPVGFPVKTSLIDTYPTDEWVEVTGKFAVMKDRDNKDNLFIIPEKISPTEQPENPYLYPY